VAAATTTAGVVETVAEDLVSSSAVLPVRI